MNTQEITQNITPPNHRDMLKQYFSHCFDRQGNFDVEKFKQELSQQDDIDFSRESYGMDWLGKSYARLLATDAATTLLAEDTVHNQQPENQTSENLLIQGDNLEVLKHLSHAYFEKIKMIYIDPPYNTGSDGFVYEDDRKFSVRELSQLAGIDGEKAKRILDFTQSKSNSHSAWLTFMYPRLYIARQLLRDDGVIFVSIDDNEVAQLRMVMDEVFGEGEFVACLVWKSRQNKDNRNKTGASIDHEYILCFSRSTLTKTLRGAERDVSQYKNPDNDDRGKWVSGNMVGLLPQEQRPNCHYDLINPDTGINYGKPKMGWRYDKSTMERLISEDRILWPANGNGRPRKKVFLKEMTELYTGFSSVVATDVYTRHGTAELESLFGKRCFDFPKPVELMKEVIKQSSDTDSIILDFFAGSATTAHAVMQQNLEDNGNRKFILVQIPEPINPKRNKTAYDFVKNDLKSETPTIFDISKERIQRAAKKIREENPDYTGDLGFKIFKTIPNDEGVWEHYYFRADEFDPQQSPLFDESQLTDEDLHTLLTTWKTYDNIPLSQNLQTIDLDGYTGFYYGSKLYLVHAAFGIKNLKKILEEVDGNPTFNPATIIAFAYNFESKALRELSENVRLYVNKKQIDMDVVLRY
jgi:adenine-specific DNA-methyltransferase